MPAEKDNRLAVGNLIHGFECIQQKYFALTRTNKKLYFYKLEFG